MSAALSPSARPRQPQGQGEGAGREAKGSTQSWRTQKKGRRGFGEGIRTPRAGQRFNKQGPRVPTPHERFCLRAEWKSTGKWSRIFRLWLKTASLGLRGASQKRETAICVARVSMGSIQRCAAGGRSKGFKSILDAN